MAESLHHIRLVEQILAHIEREYRPYHGLAVFHDLPKLLGAEKPPRIEGFVPDVYALDAPVSVTILGEAKTEDDLETDHSRRQIRAFLSFLAQQEAGVLILAVPWQAGTTARNLVANMRQSLGSCAVTVVVLDGVNE